MTVALLFCLFSMPFRFRMFASPFESDNHLSSSFLLIFTFHLYNMELCFSDKYRANIKFSSIYAIEMWVTPIFNAILRKQTIQTGWTIEFFLLLPSLFLEMERRKSVCVRVFVFSVTFDKSYNAIFHVQFDQFQSNNQHRYTINILCIKPFTISINRFHSLTFLLIDIVEIIKPQTNEYIFSL